MFGKNYEKNYTPIESLSQEEREKIRELETSADSYYSERMDFMATWKEEIKPFLKPIKVKLSDKEGDYFEKNLTFGNLNSMDRDSWVEFIDQEKLLNKYKDKHIPKVDLEKKLKKEIDQVLDILDEASDTQKELMGKTKDIDPAYSQEVRDFYGYKLKEYFDAKKRIGDFKEEEDSLVEDFEIANKMKRKRQIQQKILKNREEAENFINQTPEAFLADKYEIIENMKSVFDINGRVVETPYVRKKINQITGHLFDNRPVFLHGHLGSGKTEIAKYISENVLSGPYIAEWERNNPKEEYRSIEEWEMVRDFEKSAYIIQGHKAIDPDVFLGGIKIQRVESMTPEEMVNFKNENLESFRKKMDEAGYDAEKIKSNLEQMDKALDKSLDNPVETIPYLGLFYQAMTKGKPIILDEINAIPHHVLILLNDYLTAKPGDIIKPLVDDMPPFKVKNGFHVIATGNWDPSNDSLYVGRQQLDAAFLSRFGLVSFDYLPNASDDNVLAQYDDSIKEEFSDDKMERLRQIKNQNELFHMIITKMLDPQYGLEMPEDGFNKVYRLCVCARIIQNIVSGATDNSQYYSNVIEGRVDPSELIKENILSIRHLLPIVNKWKKDGFTKTIDYHIYKEYISRSNKQPEEQKYLYELFQTFGGFFEASEGWPDITLAESDKTGRGINELITFDPDVLLETGRTNKEVGMMKNIGDRKYFSNLEVIEAMYGPIPKRKKIRKKIERAKKGDKKNENQVVNEELETIEKEAFGEGFVEAVSFNKFLKIMVPLAETEEDFLNRADSEDSLEDLKKVYQVKKALIALMIDRGIIDEKLQGNWTIALKNNPEIDNEFTQFIEKLDKMNIKF